MKLVWVTDAEYESGFKIRLQFNDGLTGVADLGNSLKGKVFEPLKNVEYFKSFSTNSWTIEWENGADFAPEYLYHLIAQNNKNNLKTDN